MRNLIVLPDGTELYHGMDATDNIRSVSFKHCTNSEKELMMGGTFASIMEATLQTPYGDLNIETGAEVAAYKVEEDGTRHLVGLYTLEKPTRPTANTYKITAYDRVSWLDKDLAEWLNSLTVWPVPLLEFAQMVCSECGLNLTNDSIPNGDFPVQQFTADSITGRTLMRWVGEASARFLRATPDGDVELATYQENTVHEIGPTRQAATMALSDMVEITDDGYGNVSIASDYMTVEDDGDGNVTVTSDVLRFSDNGSGNVAVSFVGESDVIPYFGGALSYEDYQTAVIEKVQIRMTADDVGVVYPEIEGEANTYIIQGNYLLTTSTTEDLLPVVQAIYEEIQGITYTPCKVSIPVTLGIQAGDIVRITDANGVSFTTYVMSKTNKGQRDTLECTGSHRRDSSTVVNNESYKALNGKILELRKEVDGLYIANKDNEGRLAQLELTVDGINTEVSKQTKELDDIHTEMTEIKQNASEVSIIVQDIVDNGVDKVTTKMGYTFSDDGLHIRKEGEGLESKLDHTGLLVTQGDDPVLRATADGVNARDVTVRNYLIVGTHARFEDFTDDLGRDGTALFFI